MSLKLLKDLFHKPLFDKIDDITINEITIKDLPVMIEIYEQFEPYFKAQDFYKLVTEKTKELLIFIYICTGIHPDKLASLKSSKLLPIFDKCLLVNHGFFTQTYTLRLLKDQQLQKIKDQAETKNYKPSKILQHRIVSISKD